LREADPRLQGDNLQRNLTLVEALERLAKSKSATAAQVAIAWLIAQGDDVVPIPGVERRDLLIQNLAALQLELTADDLAFLDSTFAPGVASGNPDATLLRESGPTESQQERA